jgi:hypothetical protein
MATWTVTEEGTDGTATPSTALDGPTVSPTAPTIVAFEDDVQRSSFTGTAQTGTPRGTEGTATPSTALDGPTVSPTAPTLVAFDTAVERAAFTGVSQTGAVRGVDGSGTPTTALDGPTVTPEAPSIVAFGADIERTAFAPSTPTGAVRGIDGTATPTTQLDGPTVSPAAPTITEFEEIMRGVLLPIGDFRLVTGRVVDSQGAPIERATLLVANQWLPTAGPVAEDGSFEIRLLRSEYTDFRLLGDTDPDKEGFDLVWFLDEAVTVSSAETEDVELAFDLQDPLGGGAGTIFGGVGAHFGDPLQT